MSTQKETMKERDWEVSATCGMLGSDIDYDFFDGLTNIELESFGSHLKEVNAMYENEIKSRGL